MFRLAAAIALAVSLPAVALAQSIVVDFSSFVVSGAVSYAGGPADPLVGTGIVIDSVIGLNTPAGIGSHAVTSGALTFTTGPFTGFSGTVYSFGGAALGSFTITGGVPAAGIADGTTLLTGRLSGASVDVSSNTVYLFTADGVDVKNPQLVSFFGLGGALFLFGPAALHLSPTSQPCTAPCAFTATSLDADVPNTVLPLPQAVPTLSEWGLIALSTLLVGVALWGVRRQASPAHPA